MKRSVMLTITSLLSILLITFHLSDDIVRGFEPGGVKNIIGGAHVGRLAVRNTVLAERRSGYIIMLLGATPWVRRPCRPHDGKGLVGGRIANSSGIFFCVWTLIALQVTAIFSLILSARGLWSLPWRRGVSKKT